MTLSQFRNHFPCPHTQFTCSQGRRKHQKIGGAPASRGTLGYRKGHQKIFPGNVGDGGGGEEKIFPTLYSFTIDTIDNSDFIPEKLFALKRKTHTSGLLLPIEKNTFVSGGSIILKRWQKRLSTTCRNRTCQRGPLC